MSDLSDARRKAWATRRRLYGSRGHRGTYQRLSPALLDRALRLIHRLHEEGTLSEGQCCKALDMHRIDFRVMCDGYNAQAAPDAD